MKVKRNVQSRPLRRSCLNGIVEFWNLNVFSFFQRKIKVVKENEVLVALILISILIAPIHAYAQGALESQIEETINNLVRLLNIIILGFVAWAGFLIAKGESNGMNRLLYSVIGLVVVNAAGLIVSYFI